jgi:hypothetical protein
LGFRVDLTDLESLSSRRQPHRPATDEELDSFMAFLKKRAACKTPPLTFTFAYQNIGYEKTYTIHVKTYVIHVKTYVILMKTYVIYVKVYVIHVNTPHTPEEGAHGPSWPNGLIIIFIPQSIGSAFPFRFFSGYIFLRTYS